MTEAVFERKEDALDALEQELRLAEDAFETAAVLTFTEEEAKAVYEELKHRGREAAYIDRDSSTFERADGDNLLPCKRVGIRSGICCLSWQRGCTCKAGEIYLCDEGAA